MTRFPMKTKSILTNGDMSQRLGQHFLINPTAIQTIIAALDLQKGDTVIEIGPGKGALTIPLAQKCQKIGCELIAIEKDLSFVRELRIKNKELRIIEGDALKELPRAACTVRSREGPQRPASNGVDNLGKTRFKAVGNIPYYITGKLMRVLGDLKNKPILSVFTVQKEVADRIAAHPPHMNLLAAAVQSWAKPQVLRYLKPGDFQPSPEVDSAIIKLTRAKSDIPIRYYEIMRIIFKQPRKTALNNLAEGLKMPKNALLAILQKKGFHEKIRPQDMGVEDIAYFAQKLRGGDNITS